MALEVPDLQCGFNQSTQHTVQIVELVSGSVKFFWGARSIVLQPHRASPVSRRTGQALSENTAAAARLYFHWNRAAMGLGDHKNRPGYRSPG